MFEMSQLELDYKTKLCNALREMNIKFNRVEILMASPTNLLKIGKPKYCAIGGLHKIVGTTELKIQTGLTFGRGKVRDKFGIPKGTWYKCPKCYRCCTLLGLTVHLNDHHHLSFKDNASMIEQAEPTEKPKTAKEWLFHFAQELSLDKKLRTKKEVIGQYARTGLVSYFIIHFIIISLPFALASGEAIAKGIT